MLANADDDDEVDDSGSEQYGKFRLSTKHNVVVQSPTYLKDTLIKEMSN